MLVVLLHAAKQNGKRRTGGGEGGGVWCGAAAGCVHRTLLDGVGVGAGAASGSDQGGGGGRAGGITCVARLPCVRGSAGMINPSRPLPRTKPVGLCVSSTTITLNHPT